MNKFLLTQTTEFIMYQIFFVVVEEPNRKRPSPIRLHNEKYFCQDYD